MQTDRLIEQLASGLEPAAPLRAPAARALLWLGLVGLISAALILRYAHLGAALERLAAPRIAFEFAAAGLTALAAIVAAFELSIPDRSPRWAALPLLPFLAWLGASGLGCLRNGLHGAAGLLGESTHCFVFIVAASLPLALILFAMLRQARPINPFPVAALGTLGVAASANCILEFFHPFDVTAIDLALHLAAMACIMLIGLSLRRPLLGSA